MTLILNATIKPNMLSVIILIVVMQSVMVPFDTIHMVQKVLYDGFFINLYFIYYVYLNEIFLKLKM